MRPDKGRLTNGITPSPELGPGNLCETKERSIGLTDNPSRQIMSFGNILVSSRIDPDIDCRNFWAPSGFPAGPSQMCGASTGDSPMIEVIDLLDQRACRHELPR